MCLSVSSFPKSDSPPASYMDRQSHRSGFNATTPEVPKFVNFLGQHLRFLHVSSYIYPELHQSRGVFSSSGHARVTRANRLVTRSTCNTQLQMKSSPSHGV